MGKAMTKPPSPSKPISMLRWVFRADTIFDKGLRIGVGGLILGGMVKDAVKQVGPSADVSTIVCFVFAAILGLPALLDVTPPKDERLRKPVIALAVAYLWMGLLYFLNATNLVKLLTGYDAITDIIGTLFFALAWLLLARLEPDEDSRTADVTSFAVAFIIAVVAATAKLTTDLGGAIKPNQDAARLFLNICNGLVFLGLYGQIRRLFAPPDPATHTIILLFGCCQVAAHGRDCLSAAAQCTTATIQGIVANVIAWSLLLGKIAFAIYISYLYFNRRVDDSHPVGAGSR